MRRFHDMILPIYGGISRIINRETHVFHLNQIIQNGFQIDQFIDPFQYKIPGHSSLNDIRSQLKIMKLLWPAVLYWKSLINWSNTCNSCKIQSKVKIMKLLWPGILYWNGLLNWSVWNPFCIIWFKWKTCVSLLRILDIPP